MKYSVCWRVIGKTEVLSSREGRKWADVKMAQAACVLDSTHPVISKHFESGIFDIETRKTLEFGAFPAGIDVGFAGKPKVAC